MLPPLLTAKLAFPVERPGAIARPRLVAQLQAGLLGPLTVVSAPAGYGKTTLLSAWRAQASPDIIAAWFGLAPEDNDLARFLLYLAGALETAHAGLGSQALAGLLNTEPPPVEATLAALLHDLSGCGRQVVLVLDDYYLLTDPAIHEALAFLLAHRSANLHLVLLTREDPPLPLARLRARSELAEIRESDLRFSAAEAAAFLTDTMGLALSAQSVGVLLDRTEGWAAGLQMAALAVRAQPNSAAGDSAEAFVAAFGGDDRFVMDYLMEEVFRRQTPETQAFLLNTAVADRLNASLCAGLLADEPPPIGQPALPPDPVRLEHSQAWLDALERANLFLLPLDHRREWFRYHALFAELLRYRLAREYPGRLTLLHRRACVWHVQAGNADEAMRHALAAHDVLLAAEVAEQFQNSLIRSSRISVLLQWLQQIPSDEIRRHPYLCVGSGWAYVLGHQPAAAEAWVQAGLAGLAQFQPLFSAADGRWIGAEEVRGQFAAIRSFASMHQGNQSGAIEHAQQALDILPPESVDARGAVALNLGVLYSERGQFDQAYQALLGAVEAASQGPGNAYVASSALRALGAMAARRGRLTEAARWFQQSLDQCVPRAGQPGAAPSAAVTHVFLADLHLERYEIDAAQTHLDLALQAVGALGNPVAWVWAQIVQANLAYVRGDLGQAGVWLDQAQPLLGQHTLPDGIVTDWLVARGRAYLAQGDIAAARKLLGEERTADLEELPAPGSPAWNAQLQHLSRYILLARVLLAQNEIRQAAAFLARLSALAHTGPEYPGVIEAALGQALASQQANEPAARAQEHLESALILAAPEGYLRPFLNTGLPLVKLLRQAMVRDVQPAFAREVLAALTERERQLAGAGEQPVAARAVAESQVEPLTGRERQILRMLAAGLSSPQIASELIISVSTVRSYLKTIYQKLDAHSRAEAVDKGQQLGLF